MTLSWELPSDEEPAPEGYRVLVVPGGAELTTTAATVTVPKLRNGVRYTFTVTAIGADGRPGPAASVDGTPTSGRGGDIGRMIIAYEPGVARTDSAGVATGASSVDEVGLLPGVDVGAGMATVRLTESVTEGTAEAIAAQLTADPRIKWAEPDVLVTRLADPNDPYFLSGALWGIRSTYGVQAPAAWSVAQGSPIVVAVVDTGLVSHPDLAGQSVAGYDFVSDPSIANDGNGRDSDPSDPGDYDSWGSSSWHGTHVAGTIAAVANNGIGVVGVAPAAKIQPVRVLGTGGGYISDVVAGITWASGGAVAGVPANATPARVINMSLGGSGSCSNAEQTAVNGAISRGTVVVVAAGNDGGSASNSSPGNCNGVIAVAAVTSSGKRASFSNYGSVVDIAAPGSGIVSTVDSGSTVPKGPSYANYSGTSMAAPHVAGAVALLLSVKPGLTPSQVEAAIKNPANVTPFPGGACDTSAARTCGAGIVNAAKLVGAGPGTPPNAPTAVQANRGDRSLAVSWTAPASGTVPSSYVASAFTAPPSSRLAGTCTATLPAGCTISGLSNGTTYYVDVVASNSGGNSPASTPRVAATPATVPGAPRAVMATPSGTSISASWSAPVGNGGSAITGYTARAFAAASGGSAIGTCTSATTSCSITGLAAGQTYYIDAVATNAVGSSLASNPRTVVTLGGRPSPPTAVTLLARSGSLDVRWTAPSNTSGITGYTARAYTTATGGSIVASCTAPTPNGCRITGLRNSTTYHVDVVSQTATQTSVPSAPRAQAMPRAGLR